MNDDDKCIYLLAVAYRRYDNCNPDVGMGFGDEYFISMALSNMGWDKKKVNYNLIVAKMAK